MCLGLETLNLKDFRFAHASEWSNFKPDKYIQLNNSHDSYSSRMSIFRDVTCVPGNVLCCVPNIDRNFHSNPPMDEPGSVDVFLENNEFCLIRNKENLLKVWMLWPDAKLD